MDVYKVNGSHARYGAPIILSIFLSPWTYGRLTVGLVDGVDDGPLALNEHQSCGR
jgi:hypothetical protein